MRRGRSVERVRVVVAIVGQREVMGAGLGVRANPGRLRLADVAQRGGGRKVNDVDGRVRCPGKLHRPVGCDCLGLG